jgi:hypothetical protein
VSPPFAEVQFTVAGNCGLRDPSFNNLLRQASLTFLTRKLVRFKRRDKCGHEIPQAANRMVGGVGNRGRVDGRYLGMAIFKEKRDFVIPSLRRTRKIFLRACPCRGHRCRNLSVPRNGWSRCQTASGCSILATRTLVCRTVMRSVDTLALQLSAIIIAMTIVAAVLGSAVYLYRH